MANKAGNQLAFLVLFVMGVVAVLLAMIMCNSLPACRSGESVANCDCNGGRRIENGICGPGAILEAPGAAAIPVCGVSNPCPTGQECSDGECLPIAQATPRLPQCADGAPLTTPPTCECRPPMAVAAGKCTVAVDRCASLTSACQKVEQECRNKGIGCEGKKWSELVISDDAVNRLLNDFSDQSALLFPTNQPRHGAGAEDTANLKAVYKQFISERWPTIRCASMFIILGRASRTGSAATNEALAKARMTLISQLVVEVCHDKHESDAKCMDLLGVRGKHAAIGKQREIRSDEFAKVFEPLGPSGAPMKNWTAPNNGMTSNVAVTLAGTGSQESRTFANMFMNQAVFLVPIPCDCNPNAPQRNPQPGSASGSSGPLDCP